MSKINVGLYDDKALSIRVGQVGAAEFRQLINVIKSFPERRYMAYHKFWVVPTTAPNLAHLRASWGPDEVEIDAEAKVIFRWEEIKAGRREEVERVVTAYRYEDAIPVLPYTPKTPSYKHQTLALAALHQSESYGLLMEMGTGKTKVVIDEMCWRAGDVIYPTTGSWGREMGTGKTKVVIDEMCWASRESDHPYRVLVVCPRSIMGVWGRELERHANVEFWTGILETGKQGKKTFQAGLSAADPLKVWITTYERVGALYPMLSGIRFDLVVLDESTRIKNPKAVRTKAVLKLRDISDRRVIMTGTPVANSILDLWSQFEFLNPGALGYGNFYRFRDRYATTRQSFMGYIEVTGYQRLDELKKTMMNISFTVKKSDCLDLPPKIFETREIVMAPVQERFYKEMVREMMVTLSETTTSFASTAAVLLIRLAQICGGFTGNSDGSTTDIEGATGKLSELEDILDDCPGPVIVWARFRHDIERIENFLATKKVGCVTIHGGISEEGRADAVDAFNTGRARVLVGEPGTGGMGLTLLGPENDRCHTVVYYSCDYSLEKRAQSEDRCHRIGQTMPVTYIDLVMVGTVEVAIVAAVQAKKSLSESMKDMDSLRNIVIGGEK